MSTRWQSEIAITEAIELLRGAALCSRFAGAASEEDVEVAERTLGIRLPHSYRRFLKTLGCGSLGGREYDGIVPGRVLAEGAPCVVWLNTQNHKRGMPGDWIEVSETGFGEVFVLRVDKAGRPNENGEFECPVDLWSPGTATIDSDEVAESFGAFFLEGVRQVTTPRRAADSGGQRPVSDSGVG